MLAAALDATVGSANENGAICFRPLESTQEYVTQPSEPYALGFGSFSQKRPTPPGGIRSRRWHGPVALHNSEVLADELVRPAAIADLDHAREVEGLVDEVADPFDPRRERVPGVRDELGGGVESQLEPFGERADDRARRATPARLARFAITLAKNCSAVDRERMPDRRRRLVADRVGVVAREPETVVRRDDLLVRGAHDRHELRDVVAWLARARSVECEADRVTVGLRRSGSPCPVSAVTNAVVMTESRQVIDTSIVRSYGLREHAPLEPGEPPVLLRSAAEAPSGRCGTASTTSGAVRLSLAQSKKRLCDGFESPGRCPTVASSNA